MVDILSQTEIIKRVRLAPERVLGVELAHALDAWLTR